MLSYSKMIITTHGRRFRTSDYLNATDPTIYFPTAKFSFSVRRLTNSTSGNVVEVLQGVRFQFQMEKDGAWFEDQMVEIEVGQEISLDARINEFRRLIGQSPLPSKQ